MRWSAFMETFRNTRNYFHDCGVLFLWYGSIGDDYCIQIRLSVLQPMLSLNYVLSIILAAIVLKEEITILKSIGVLVIIAGVVMIAGGDEE